ncbi:hypothetical protein RB195_022264 [Necator americanus]
MTLLILVFLPTIATVFNTGYKIIRAMRNPNQLEDSQRMIIETDPNFVLTMFLLVAFVLSWLPLLCLKVFEYFVPPQSDADLSLATFIFVWLAIAGPSAKFLIYMFINGAFRTSFLSWRPCVFICCPLSRNLDYRDISSNSHL